jgi:hypothetical protein
MCCRSAVRIVFWTSVISPLLLSCGGFTCLRFIHCSSVSHISPALPDTHFVEWWELPSSVRCPPSTSPHGLRHTGGTKKCDSAPPFGVRCQPPTTGRSRPSPGISSPPDKGRAIHCYYVSLCGGCVLGEEAKEVPSTGHKNQKTAV